MNRFNHAIKLFLFSVLILPLTHCGSQEKQLRKLFNPETYTYTNKALGCRLKLLPEPGWAVTPMLLTGKEGTVIFHALHQGKLVDLLLVTEPLNSDLEDYTLVFKSRVEKKHKEIPVFFH